MKLTSRNSLVLLLMVALAVRLAAGWAWQSRLHDRFGMGDSDGYWMLGQTIAKGEPYEYGLDHALIFRTPGYPILLAPIFWIAGDGRGAVLLARAEAALLGVLAVVAVWWLTRLLFDDRAALVAAALATFYPGAIALSILIFSEAPFCPLMLLQLGLWIVAFREPTHYRMSMYGFLAGLAAGTATLMRPSWLLFTPLAAGAGIMASSLKWNSDSLARHSRITLWMILGLVMAMMPWWLRNARVAGCFVPTTLQVGASLYDGLNPRATGASNMDFVPQFVAAQRERSAKTGPISNATFELQLDRRLRDEAVVWADANPGRAVKLAGVKFLRMWNVWPNEPQLSSWPIRMAVLFTYTPLLFFAIIGAWRTARRGWPYVLCCLPAVYFTLVHMVFVSSIRYREPAMLALLALAAGGGIRDWGLEIRCHGDESTLASNP